MTTTTTTTMPSSSATELVPLLSGTLRTFVAEKLFTAETSTGHPGGCRVFTRGGDDQSVLSVGLEELLKATGGVVIDCVKGNGEESAAGPMESGYVAKFNQVKGAFALVFALRGVGMAWREALSAVSVRNSQTGAWTLHSLSTAILDERGSGVTLLLDSMLSVLARSLRVMGMDAELFPKVRCSAADDLELIAAADAKGRVIVTRDRKLALRRDTPSCIFLQTCTIEGMLNELKSTFKFKFSGVSKSPCCAPGIPA